MSLRTAWILLWILLGGCSLWQPQTGGSPEAIIERIAEHDWSSGDAQFQPARTRLVDRVGANWLYRGSMPARDGRYLYSELVDQLRDLATSAGNQLPDRFELVSISLMSPLREPTEIELERAWFQLHDEWGRFEHRPLYGVLIKPEALNAKLRGSLAKRFDHWDRIPSRLLRVRRLLEEQGEVSRVVYVHCAAGVDRTGSLMGAYAMTYLGRSLDEALAWNQAIGGRAMNAYTENALRWYATYLSIEGSRLGTQ